MLFFKELKNNSRFAVMAGVLILVLAVMLPILRFPAAYIVMFYEILVSMIVAIYCSNMILNGGDLEICLTCNVSAFRLFLMKYLSLMSLVFVMGAIQLIISIIFFNIYIGVIILMAFFPAVLILSSLSFYLSLFFKSVNTSAAILVVFIAFEVWVGDSLSKHLLPRYYYEFISVFDTTYMYRHSNLWLTNRIVMIAASVLIWILIFVLIKIRKRELV